MDARIEPSMVYNCIMGVAGGEQHFNIGAALLCFIGQLPSIEWPGKADIGKQKLYVWLACEEAKSRIPLVCLQYSISELMKNFRRVCPDIGIVFDHENGLVTAELGHLG